MFGYVRPVSQALTEDEERVYRALYCSLCDALRRLGFGAKLFLNYDFVFAAMLLQCCTDGQTAPISSRCNTNPFKKVGRLSDPVLQSVAAALVLVSRCKLQDDGQDERFFRRIAAGALRLLTTSAGRRAARTLPGLCEVLDARMAQQAALERERCGSYDRAADPSAEGLSFLLASLVPDESLRAVYERMGYLLGRFVYLADAANDLADDLRLGRYNPAIVRCGLTVHSGPAALDDARDELRDLLRQTAAGIELCWRLVPAKRFVGILDSILYAGLTHTIETVGSVHERKS